MGRVMVNGKEEYPMTASIERRVKDKSIDFMSSLEC